MGLAPKGNLLHLRLWYGSVVAKPDLAYDNNWDLSLTGSLRLVERTNMRPQTELKEDTLHDSIAVAAHWCYPQLGSTDLSFLRRLSFHDHGIIRFVAIASR